MIGLFLIIALNIIAAISTFATSTDTIFQEEGSSNRSVFRKRVGKKLNKKGKILIGTFIATILIAVFQYFQNRADERKNIMRQDYRDSVAKQEKYLSDSISNAHIEDSKQQTIEALAKYGYKTDSLNDNLLRIVRDSSNRKLTVIQGETPILNFCYVGGIKFKFERNDSLVYELMLCSQNAGAILKEATVYTVASENLDFEPIKRMHYIKSLPFIGKQVGIEKGAGNGVGQSFTLKPKALNFPIKTIYVALIGEYTDSYGKNLKKMRQVAILNLTNKEGGMLAGEFEAEIYKFLESVGVVL